MKTQLLWLVLMATLGTSCMRSVSITVLQPAEFKVPDHIAKVAVIDRSKPSNGWLSALEGLVSGEAIGQDRASREQAVRGLTDALQRTPRFNVISTGIEMSGSKAGGNMPAQLAWREVEKICADYGSDALVAIESFDSDNNVSTRSQQNKRKDKSGNTVTSISYTAELRSSVRMGWRMYDPLTRTIIDEYVTDDFLKENGSGGTEKAAKSNLPSQVDLTRRVSFIAGRHYGMRIAPVYVDLSRSYYPKGKGYQTEMKNATRLARGNNWEKAAEIWKQVEVRAATAQPKTAGKAAYNMAVASELAGNTDIAIEWAKTAWEKYGNKKARVYIATLQKRKVSDKRAESQLNKKVAP